MGSRHRIQSALSGHGVCPTLANISPIASARHPLSINADESGQRTIMVARQFQTAGQSRSFSPYKSA